MTVIGHSMGGYVALALGELYPDLIKKNILIASTATADNIEKRLNRDRAIEVIKKNPTTFIRIAVDSLFNPIAKEQFPEQIKHTINEALKTPTQGIIAALEGMKIRNDREIILHLAPFPTHFIIGTNDRIAPEENIIAQTENTQSKIMVIKSGHMIHIEAKKELIQALSILVKS